MTLLTIFVGVIALSNLVLLLGLAYLAIAVKKLIDTSVKPAVSEAQSTIHNVNVMVDKVEDKAEQILNIGEETARKVSGSVVATTDMVQDTVTPPLISFSSMVAGISKALETWRRASAKS